MWRLRYAGVDVVRISCASTANLYVIRCWTGSQCSWRSSGLVWDRLGAWRTIRAALFWTRFVASGCCRMECHGAVVEPWQYQTTGKRLCNLSRQQMANVADGLVVVIARSRNCWNVLLESQVPIYTVFQTRYMFKRAQSLFNASLRSRPIIRKFV